MTISGELASIIIALITIFGSIIVAMIGRSQKATKKDLKEINDSVNHRHQKGDGRGVMDYCIGISKAMGTIEGDVKRIQGDLSVVKSDVQSLADRGSKNTARIKVLEGGDVNNAIFGVISIPY